MNEYLFFIPIAIALGFGVMSPGPSFIYVAQVAMQKTRAQGVATALGLGTGALIYALVAILGLFVVLHTMPMFYLVFKVVGGLYLLYLAYKMWTAPSNTSVENLIENGSTQKKDDLFKYYLMGLFIQLSNPKTAIVIGGIFMAFLPEQIPDFSVVLLSLLAFIIDAGWYLIVAITLSTASAQKFYLRFEKMVNRVAGGLMGLLGLKLLFNQ